jgi:hypothetical protein
MQVSSIDSILRQILFSPPFYFMIKGQTSLGFKGDYPLYNYPGYGGFLLQLIGCIDEKTGVSSALTGGERHSAHGFDHVFD